MCVCITTSCLFTCVSSLYVVAFAVVFHERFVVGMIPACFTPCVFYILFACVLVA